MEKNRLMVLRAAFLVGSAIGFFFMFSPPLIPEFGWYAGIDLAAIALFLAIMFLLKKSWRDKNTDRVCIAIVVMTALLVLALVGPGAIAFSSGDGFVERVFMESKFLFWHSISNFAFIGVTAIKRRSHPRMHPVY